MEYLVKVLKEPSSYAGIGLGVFAADAIVQAGVSSGSVLGAGVAAIASIASVLLRERGDDHRR